MSEPSGVDDATALRAASRWVARFRTAAVAGDPDGVAGLLDPDGSWRDLLALTWDIHTYYGHAQVREALAAAFGRTNVLDVALDTRIAPRLVQRGGVTAVEAFFTLQTAAGNGRGVVRLEVAERLDMRALTLLTTLQELRGAPDPIGSTGDHAGRFGGPNWLDRRREAVEFVETDPTVLVVGGGQAGIAAAAHLGQLGVSTLVVDRSQRVGDNWRKRYHSLVLHNEVWVNHLPFLPFPDNWPTYVPKDKLANWFEAYVESMEINYWTDTEFLGGTYDAVGGFWVVRVRRGDGVERELRPRHVVLATGVSGIPNVPKLPGIVEFGGTVIHSSEYTDGLRFAGQRILVVGSGNSGHDVAQDLHASGATVTMVQRSSTTVASVGPNAAGRVYGIYGEGLPTEDCDLLTLSVDYPQMRRSHQLITAELLRQDADLIAGLERAGFRVDAGEDGTGFQMKYLRRGGGYYLNVGCSELIIDGSVRLVQNADVETFQRTGVRLVDGSEIEVDIIVLATGYLPQQELVRRLFGDDVAERVGPVWGFDDEGELRNMWKRTTQSGLWFTAGSLAQCRIFSRFLGLQIRACEDGLLGADCDMPNGKLRPDDLVDAILPADLVEAAR
ncbi:NAD(P)/FAD-dependent oxidoreductase [Streptomyces sp. NPDC005708]|uniref:NAD(P)/FAD-dependent oxidoreductase n=1 Tax=Streptomyces sp. NPDC005708 TaxID=3154564 RepID=UPI0033D498CD